MTTALYREALVWVYDRLAPHFLRSESRRRAWTYLVDLPRLAEAGRRKGAAAGRGETELRGDGVQRLLKTARWDEDAVLGELQDFVRDLVHPASVDLVVTEMSFRKRGTQTAAVALQFSVDDQRLENAQVAMMLHAVTSTGEVYLVDRRLYVPSVWQRDTARCRAAGIPSSHCGAGKTELVLDMVTRALTGGVARGAVSVLVRDIDGAVVHRCLSQLRVPHFLLCVPPTASNKSAGNLDGSMRMPRSEAPRESWCGQEGTFSRFPGAEAGGFVTSLVAHLPPRRGGAQPRRDQYLTHVRAETSLRQLAERISLARRAWQRSRAFKEQVGLDHYEVRSWVGWHRHMTLACAAQIAYQLAQVSGEARQPGIPQVTLWRPCVSPRTVSERRAWTSGSRASLES